MSVNISFRPGFIRISIPFFMPKEEIDFVIDSVEWVSEVGWKLLPQVCKSFSFMSNEMYNLLGNVSVPIESRDRRMAS